MELIFLKEILNTQDTTKKSLLESFSTTSEFKQFSNVVKDIFEKYADFEFEDEASEIFDTDGVIKTVLSQVDKFSSLIPARGSVNRVEFNHYTSGESDAEFKIYVNVGICDFVYNLYVRPFGNVNVLFYAAVKHKFISKEYLAKHNVEEVQDFPTEHGFDSIFSDSKGLFEAVIKFPYDEEPKNQQADSLEQKFQEVFNKLEKLVKVAEEAAKDISEWFFGLTTEFDDPKIEKIPSQKDGMEVWSLRVGYVGAKSDGTIVKG